MHEATEEGVRLQWLSTVTGADDGKLTIEKMVLDETGFPQPTGEFEDLEADTLVLALGQESDLSLLRTLPAVRTRDGNVAVDRDMMTDHPGVFAGGDMVAGARTLTDAIGHGKKAAHAIDAWMRGVGDRPPTFAQRWPRSTGSTPGTTPMHRSRSVPISMRLAVRRPSTRSWGVWTNRRRSSRPGGACHAAIASSATTASACAPTTRSVRWRMVTGIALITTIARAADSAYRNAPAAPSTWYPRRSEPTRAIES